MYSVTDAQQVILSTVQPLGTERIGILDGVGRALAEEIVARQDQPPWDNSAMDGVAVRWEDIRFSSKRLPVTLKLKGEITAGELSTRHLDPGETILIMTGAPIPPGADTVVRIEETHRTKAEVQILASVRRGEHIRARGENVRKGHVVLTPGTELRAAQIGMLASVGHSMVTVFRRPHVAIMATGDELAELDEPLDNRKIYNSNSYALAAQVLEAGGIPLLLGIVPDSKKVLEEKLSQMRLADLLLISGGVSMGQYDYVKDVLKELSAEFKFWRVRMRPGHPVGFGLFRDKPFFGLPGNPVSAMVTFEQFVRPLMRKLQGYLTHFLPVTEVTLQKPIVIRRSHTHFIRGIVVYNGTDATVCPTGPQGSGILDSMVKANCFIVIGEKTEKIEAGERVKVQLLGAHLSYRVDPGF